MPHQPPDDPFFRAPVAPPPQQLPGANDPNAAPVQVTERMGLMPRNIDELWRLSTLLAESEMVPKSFRGKPGNVCVALQYGIELGLTPMQALQSIAVINGHPAIYGDAVIGLVMRSGLLETITEMDVAEIAAQEHAVCTVKRRGFPPHTVTFTYDDARQAGLLDKEGPWHDYPARMCLWRARSWALRDRFPDVLKGLWVAEEAWDIPSDEPRNITPHIPMPTAKTPPPTASPPEDSAGVGARETPAHEAPPPPESEPEPKRPTRTRRKVEEPPPPENGDVMAQATQMALDAFPGATVVSGGEQADAPLTQSPGFTGLEFCSAYETLPKSVRLSGRDVRTAGVGALGLAKLLAVARRFDEHFQTPGHWREAAAMALKTKVPESAFHLTDVEAVTVFRYLTEALTAAAAT